MCKLITVDKNIKATPAKDPLKIHFTEHFIEAIAKRRINDLECMTSLVMDLCRQPIGGKVSKYGKSQIIVGERVDAKTASVITIWKYSKSQAAKLENKSFEEHLNDGDYNLELIYSAKEDKDSSHYEAKIAKKRKILKIIKSNTKNGITRL